MKIADFGLTKCAIFAGVFLYCLDYEFHLSFFSSVAEL